MNTTRNGTRKVFSSRRNGTASSNSKRCRQWRTVALAVMILSYVVWASFHYVVWTSFHSHSLVLFYHQLQHQRQQGCGEGEESDNPACRRQSSITRPSPTALSSLTERIDSGILYTNLPEFEGRRAHMEELVRAVGYFHTIPFDTACPTCSKNDGKIMSHVRLLMRIAQEIHERYVIILEDDVELAQHVSRSSFLTTLDAEVKLILDPSNNDDFVYLGVCMTPEMEAACSPQKCSPWGTHAYMVTPRGARRLMRAMDAKYGTTTAGQAIALNELVGLAPVLGWNYTHDQVNGGWRGFFFQSRQSPWRLPSAVNTTSNLTVTVAHKPRNDMLGSFVTPTFLLYSICQFHGWHLEILPYTGSESERTMKDLLSMGNKVDSSWGSGLMDASNRAGYDPMKLNADSYDTMGFFPPVSNTSTFKEWIPIDRVLEPGRELVDECRRHNRTHRLNNECNLLLPDDPYILEAHMKRHGGFEVILTKAFRDHARTVFLETNGHRLKHFQGGGYHVAIHVRRGDILVGSFRWVDQFVYAKVARHICSTHPEAHIHIFSAGKNPDGNWSALEGLTTGESKCATVAIHLDEVEFDTWAHLVAADVLVMSKSNFGLIPSLLSNGEVFYPNEYWHMRLSTFRIFNSVTGEILPPA